jgi:hypothetical protein
MTRADDERASAQEAPRFNVRLARSAFLRGIAARGWSVRGDHALLPLDADHALTTRFDAGSRNRRVLAGCELGILCRKHQLVGQRITDHLVGMKAQPHWKRFWPPTFTAAWMVTLDRRTLPSQGVRTFELHWRQACWYHHEEAAVAAGEVERLVDFVAGDGAREVATYASDARFPAFLDHAPLARGPNDIVEAIGLFAAGDAPAGRRILRGEIPKKNPFVPEIYPGILERLEGLHASGELARLWSGQEMQYG